MSWESMVIVVAGGLLLTLPSNWAVRRVLRMARHEAPQSENKAGRWIGVLERLLIYVLVLIGSAAAATRDRRAAPAPPEPCAHRARVCRASNAASSMSPS